MALRLGDTAPNFQAKMTFKQLAETNFNVLRVVDALQLSTEFSISTPAEWQPGGDVIVANTVSTNEAVKRSPKP